MESDRSYFSRRATQERAAALRARSTKARNAHLELAAHYDSLKLGVESAC
jgi:hypothetical protein